MPDNLRNNFAEVAAQFRNVPASSISVAGQGNLKGAIFSFWYSVGECAQLNDRCREARLRNGAVGFASRYDVRPSRQVAHLLNAPPPL